MTARTRTKSRTKAASSKLLPTATSPGSALRGVTRLPMRGMELREFNAMIAAIENPAAHSSVMVKNRVRLHLVGPDGKIKQRTPWIENIMCTFGLNKLCSFVADGGNGTDWVSAGRIGTDTTAAASTQDSLIASTGSVAVSQSNASGTGSRSNKGARTTEFQFTYESNNPAGAATINEVGLFCNSAANSGMAARTVLGTASINKGASDRINLSHQVVFTTA